MSEPVVGIVMGSDSDWPMLEPAAETLAEFDVPYEVHVVSAHRTPRRMLDYAETAAGRGLRVVIAGAGGAAHLPGMVAAATPLPVIGVPRALDRLDGMDSLLSIVQMPAGVPVATVGIGGGRNAGLLAVRILGAVRRAAAHGDGPVPGGPGRAGRGARPRPAGASGCRGIGRRAYAVPVGNDVSLYALTDEHEAIREAVREIAEREIAPVRRRGGRRVALPDRGAEGADAGRLPRHPHPGGLRR